MRLEQEQEVKGGGVLDTATHAGFLEEPGEEVTDDLWLVSNV